MFQAPLVVQNNLLEALAIDEYRREGSQRMGIETHTGRGDSSSLDCCPRKMGSLSISL
jgi:hypothetical protein